MSGQSNISDGAYAPVMDRAWILLSVARNALTSDNFEMRDYVMQQIGDFLADHPQPTTAFERIGP